MSPYTASEHPHRRLAALALLAIAAGAATGVLLQVVGITASQTATVTSHYANPTVARMRPPAPVPAYVGPAPQLRAEAPRAHVTWDAEDWEDNEWQPDFPDMEWEDSDVTVETMESDRAMLEAAAEEERAMYFQVPQVWPYIVVREATSAAALSLSTRK